MPDPNLTVVATFSAPWGPLRAAATTNGIVALAMFADEDAFEADLANRWLNKATRDDTSLEARAARRHVDALNAALATYFEGAPTGLDVPIDLRVGSAWDRLVLDGVGAIDPGTVASYGEVATQIGRRGAARAVGGAVGRNPIAILVPCHRVVAAGGRIGGYGGDWYGTREERLAVKRELLRLEGVVLADDEAIAPTTAQCNTRAGAA